MSRLRHWVVDLSSRRPGLSPKQFNVGFLMDSVTPEQISFRVQRVFLVTIIQTVLNSDFFIHHRRYNPSSCERR